jgi:excisionase family DNA binding protein
MPIAVSPLLISVVDAAEALGCSRRTVLRLIRSGRLGAVQFAAGGPWRVPVCELERLAEPLTRR